MSIDLKKLAEPFPENQIEWRIGQAGKKANGQVWAKCLAYVQARAIMDRLDAVVGPEGWRVSYEFIGAAGVICNLAIKCGDEWVTKQDGAEQTDIESFKGGISSALKRAGSAWGIGRYLYDLEAGFANICDKGTKGSYWAKHKEGWDYNWLPPSLPDWALPAGAISNHAPSVVPQQPPLGVGIQPLGYVFPYGSLAKKEPSKCTMTQLEDYCIWLTDRQGTKERPSTWAVLAMEKALEEIDKIKRNG